MEYEKNIQQTCEYKYSLAHFNALTFPLPFFLKIHFFLFAV
jgi:hypothetical protein